MSTSKSIIFAGNYAVATTGAQTFTPALDGQGNKVIGNATVEFSQMDVLLNVITLAGTSPTVDPSIQERFSGVGFVETANSAVISTTGKYFLAHDGQTGQTGAPNVSYGFAMLGKGTDKQIVFTNGGTISSVSIDVYFIFYH